MDGPAFEDTLPLPEASTQTAAPVEGPAFEDTFDPAEIYSTTKQQTIGGIEAVGRGIAGPLFTGAEKLFGANEENILGRQKALNPIVGGTLEAGGLGLSMLTGVGEGALAAKVGEAAQGILKVKEAADVAKGVEGAAKATSLISKIGSSAVQQAAEMAVISAGDESSKLILHDPEASAESAIANIGLSAALGGAGGAIFTGAVSPLWKATAGKAAEEFLNPLMTKLGGIEGAESQAQALATKADVAIPDILAAKIDGIPVAERGFSKLSQSDTTIAGRHLQETLDNFHNELGDKMLETVGHEPSYVNKMPEVDKYTTGANLANDLSSDLKESYAPTDKAYTEINAKFKQTPFSAANISKTSEAISEKAAAEGWHKAESDAAIKLAERVSEKLPAQTTAEDLKKFITNLRETHPFGSETYKPAKDIANILREAQERAVTEGIMTRGGSPEEAKALLDHYTGLKAQYADFMTKIDNLNEHLHVGRYDGPKSFIEALKEKGSSNGEAILRGLSGTSKAQVLDALNEISPKTLRAVRQYHLDTVLTKAAGNEGKISPYKFMKEFDKLSPQVKNLVADEAAQGRLKALHDIADRLIDPAHNYSNTARTIEKLTHGKASPLSLIAALAGHGGAAILSYLGELGFTEGKDALTLGMLKLLGSNQPLKAEGFKSMVNYIAHSLEGSRTMTKAIANVFKKTPQVIAVSQMPSKAETKRLDKIVESTTKAPDTILHQQNSDIGHYMPDHQVGVAQASTRAISYLQSIKPQPYKPGPLDKEVPPSQAEMARYQRALDIAQAPAIIMQHVKDGTLQASDLQDLGAMYPKLYEHMAAEVSKNLIDADANKEAVPYKTRMGISMFLAHPIDNTMNPPAIQKAQATFIPKLPPQPAPAGKPQGKELSKLGGKTTSNYMTPIQSSEAHHGNRE